MAKGFKLRISLPSLRICRSNKSSDMPKSPSVVTRTFTPVNPETFDIAFPKSPASPPSTPNHPLCKRNISFKISQFGSGCVSMFSTGHISPSCNMDSPGYRMEKDFENIHKLCNSPVSQYFDEFMRPVDSSQTEMSDSKGMNSGKDPATRFTMSISSGDTGFFSFMSSEDCEQNDETEGLLSSCSSLDSSYDFGYPLKTRSDQKVTYGSKRKKKMAKMRRVKRYASHSWKDGEKITVSTTMAESESAAVKKTVFDRLMPCMVDGKVNESYAVMKRSADPYDDFKKSMLDMILEKKISEAEELEKLLMCFLSLNARVHHAAIVEAFTEVWEELFCKS